MTSPSMRLLAAAKPGVGGGFDPVAALAWHSLWYAEGPDMVAQGYANGAAVGTWPNETAERDQVQAAPGAKPLYIAMTLMGYVGAETQATVWRLGHVFNGGAADSNALFVNTYWQLDSGYPHNGYWTPVDVNTPKMIRGVFSGTGPAHYGYENETLKVTWTPSGFTAARFGMGSGPFGGSYKAMKLAFLGIYQGDITANPNWAEFKAWVATHYGITLA